METKYALDSNTTKLKWKIDGQILSSDQYFSAKQPKFVSVTCEFDCPMNMTAESTPEYCNYSAQMSDQTYLLCTFDDQQMELVKYAAIPIICWIVAFAVYLQRKTFQFIRIESVGDDESNTDTTCFKRICLIIALFLACLKPILASSQYVFDVVTDWLLLGNHALRGHIYWAMSTFIFMQLSTLVNFWT